MLQHRPLRSPHKKTMSCGVRDKLILHPLYTSTAGSVALVAAAINWCYKLVL